MVCSIRKRLSLISLSGTVSIGLVSVEVIRGVRHVGHVSWFVDTHFDMSFLQNMCPHVWLNLVTPSSSGGCAGESIACAISSSARMERKGTKQIGHLASWCSRDKRSASERDGRFLVSAWRACWLRGQLPRMLATISLASLLSVS